MFQLPSSESIKKIMDARMRKSDLPAMVAMAVNEKGETCSYAYGPAVWSEKEPVTTQHIFRIASMTKAITSVAAMQLVEQGKIGLHDDLSPILPEMTKIPILKDGKYEQGTKPITLFHLLTHTSGFAYPVTDEVVANFDDKNWSYQDAPRRFECGERFLYGTSIVWVGRLISKISGVDLQTYIRTNICIPLEMHHTYFDLPEELKPLVVSFGHRGSDGKQPLEESEGRIPTEKVEEYMGDGGLYSSPIDYTKFLTCILQKGKDPNGKEILKRETLESMFENQIGAINMAEKDFYFKLDYCCDFKGMITPSSKWGLAWMIDTEDKPYGRKANSVLWGGLWNTYFYIDPTSGVAASIYTQHLPFNHCQTISLFEEFSKLIYKPSLEG